MQTIPKPEPGTDGQLNKQDAAKIGFSLGIVLVEPEIPQNTGNIARTCAALGCTLHLIEPLGFSLDNRYMRRAGVDYWPQVKIKTYPNCDIFFNENPQGRYYFFSRRGNQGYTQAQFQGQTFLIFGKESSGLPDSLLYSDRGTSYHIPMLPGVRSLNLSSAVAVVAYEVFRQNGFPGLQDE